MEDDFTPVKHGILASKLTSDGDMLPVILPYRDGLQASFKNFKFDFVFFNCSCKFYRALFKLCWS